MKKNNFVSYVLTLCVVMLVNFFCTSCANEEMDKLVTNLTLQLQLQIKNYTGYSTGDLHLEPLGTSVGDARIELSQTKIEVEPEQLGKVALTSQTEPTITKVEAADSIKSYHGTKNFRFSDTQTAAAVWNYMYELVAKYHWEVVDIQFVDYKSELINDAIARIDLNFDVICKENSDEHKEKRFTMSPGYYQYVKGAKIDDTPIITTDDQIGGSTGDVTAIDPAFSAKVWLKLAQTSITVKKDQFGKVSLSQAGTPQSVDISRTDSLGNQITFADNFVDSQKASVSIRNAHHKNAEFYYTINELKYIDYTATAISDKQYLITLHYRGSFVHSDGSKKGTFDLYPKYYQMLEEEKPAELTYKVDSTYVFLSSGSIIWRATIERSDGKKWEQKKTVAFVGDVHGRNVFGVSEALVVDKRDSNKEHQDLSITEPDGENWTIKTSYYTWRWERYFANPANKDLSAETEIVFWTKQLTFKDSETGWTLTTKPLVKSCKILQDEIINEDDAPKTMKDPDHDHDYTYVGSHKLQVECDVDGIFFHSSTATTYLYKW